jgi:hypothetical protein
MAKIENPREGGDVNRLWRILSQVVDAVNALTSGKVVIEKLGPEEKASGRVMMADGNSALHLRLPQGGGEGLPPFPDDHSKKYALCAVWNGTKWVAQWMEICAV